MRRYVSAALALCVVFIAIAAVRGPAAQASAPWSANPMRINSVAGTACTGTLPALAVDWSGNAYAAWLGPTDTDSACLQPKLLTSYRSAEATWEPSVALNTPRPPNRPHLASDYAGNGFMVWSVQDERWPDGRMKPQQVYFSQHRRGPETAWSSPALLREFSGNSVPDPAIAASADGTVYVAWVEDNRLVSTHRPPNGAWSKVQVVYDAPGQISVDSTLSLAVSGEGSAHLVWSNASRTHIYQASLIQGGTAWSAPVQVDDDTSGQIKQNPALAADQAGNLYAVWEDLRAHAQQDIFGAVRPRGSAAWGRNQMISETPDVYHVMPQISVLGNYPPAGSASSFRLWISWQDNSSSPPAAIKKPLRTFARSSLLGSAFALGPSERVDNIDDGGRNPDMASSGSTVAVDASGRAFVAWSLSGVRGSETLQELFFSIRQSGQPVPPQPTLTPTNTPTKTPTLTPTATATSTPRPLHRYLPVIALRNQ